MRILALLLAFAAALLPAAAESLLDNGGFEQGEPPAGWRLPPREVFRVDRAITAEGRCSLRYENYSPEHEGPWTISHSLVALPGRAFQVRGQIRPSAFKGTVRALLLVGDGLFGDLRTVGRATLVSSADSATTSGWQSFTFLAAPGAFGGQASLRFVVEGSGIVWFDALEVTVEGGRRDDHWRPDPGNWPPTYRPGGENLLADCGFEATGAGGPCWRKFLNPQRANGIVCAFDRSRAYRGDNCALVSNRSPFFWDPAGWMQEIPAPTPGTDLLLTGYLSAEDVQGNAYMRLECWGRRQGADGTTVRDEELLAAASSDGLRMGGNIPWTPVMVRLRVPQGTTRVVTACALAGRGTAWFDELRLVGGR